MLPAPHHSYKRLFTQGIISGIGWAVGTTVGFALLLALLGGLFTIVGDIPFFNNLIRPILDTVNQPNTPSERVILDYESTVPLR